jgi:hypothetical protein
MAVLRSGNAMMTEKPDMRSELIKAQAVAMGRKVNACPFHDADGAKKCQERHLDEHGYCRHLVGFSNDGKTYEPMVRNAMGKRIVRPKMIEVEEIDSYDDDGKPVMAKILKPTLSKVRPGDVLVRISTSFRVYRDPTAAKAEKHMDFTEPTEEEKDKAILEMLKTDDFAVVK